tara:strand:+ start:79 stop:582 length:504 start_codon:yes stop_codon:yes gene_type:complete
MKFSLGDKVLFKRENIEAEVISINSPYKVRVLSEDGFELNVSIKDLVKIEEGTDNISSYGNRFISKDVSRIPKRSRIQQNQRHLTVDLHIEALRSDYKIIDRSEIIQIQLNECYKTLDKALSSNITKIVIIHGVGQGVLMKAVQNILSSYNLRFYLSQDGGATEVFL